MKTMFLFIIAALVCKDAFGAMTEAQVKSALKLLKNVCQPKAKVTNAQIDEMHTGVFNQDDAAMMAYMECILRTGQIFKDGKINYEPTKAQMANLPPSLGEPALKTLDICKDKITSTDKLMSAFQFYKCYYDENPAGFYLP